MSTRIHTMIRDDDLDLLRRAVLENPDEDTVRGIYADRLDELGRHDEAEMIRRQLKDPHLTHTVAGAKIGLPLITKATFKRGFVHKITVPANHITVPVKCLRRLGDVVRDHPVARIRVEATGVVRIAFREPGPTGGPDGTGRRRRGQPAQGWFAITLNDLRDWSWFPPSTYLWDSRDAMVKGIGPVVGTFVKGVLSEIWTRRQGWGERDVAWSGGYRAGKAWADSVATPPQPWRLFHPFPDDTEWADDLGPREQLYARIVGRHDDATAIEAFWTAALGDAAVIDNEDFAEGFRGGAWSRLAPE
jgi:uncharacterized protein (TIGR02996 family)